jgi:hypothetical protein
MLAHDFARGLDPALMMADADLAPDGWQLDVLRSTHRRQMLCCSRQSGKSTVSACVALHQALYVPDSLVLLLSPSLRQSSELFRKVIEVYRRLDGMPDLAAESALRLELPNNSRIVSLPGSESTIRGYSAPALIVIDEAAHASDGLIGSTLPMLATRDDGRLLVLSTPNGKLGWYFESWTNDESWEKTLVTWKDCPRISEDNVAFFRRTMGELLYQQEFECNFLDQAESVFPLHLIDSAFTEEFGAWL